MTPFPFDRLGASKQLREAGMPEGMAEAVVSVFQHAALTPDFGHLATKTDIADMATRADLLPMATKADIADMATKSDLSELRLATRADLLELEVRVMERMRQQGWAMLGGMTVLLAVSTGIGRLIA